METIVPSDSNESESELFREEPPYFESRAPQDQEQVFSSGLVLLENPRGVHDLKSAVSIFRDAAKHGHAGAKYQLGKMLLDGVGTLDSPEQALVHILAAAEQGVPEAQFEAGRLLIAGIGTPADESAGIMWMKAAAEQGDQEALFYLGMCYFKGRHVDQDFARSYACLEKAAQSNRPAAMCAVGFLHWHGLGAEQNHKKAFDHLLAGAKCGYPEGFYLLSRFVQEHQGDWDIDLPNTIGRCDEFDVGSADESDNNTELELPDELAFESDADRMAHLLLHEAATLGHDQAQFELGKFLLESGMKEPGCEWLQAAADQHHCEAYVVLADYYRPKARGWENSVEYYAKAARLGSAEAAEKFFKFYGKDSKTPDDFTEKRWLEFMARLGHPRAMCDLAHQLYLGIGYKQDNATAFAWFLASAEAGDNEAQRRVALCYGLGEGTKKNVERAQYWKTLAAKHADSV